MAKATTVFNDLYNTVAQEEGTRPGRPLLEEAEIDYGGVRHGLTQYIQEITIYEDIDKVGLTGNISLMDVDNLVSGFISSSPAGGGHTIVGQELLYLKFKTFGSDLPVDFTKHPLHVHKIEALAPLDPTGQGASSVGAQIYRIHFVSPELMNNDRVRVSQAYEDTYSEIVKDILKTHLKTKKDVWIEKTKDIIKVVIPNMHPLNAIAEITKWCVSKGSIPNYNFYETTKGYRFKTVHNQAAGATGRAARLGNPDLQMIYTIPSGTVDGNFLTHMISTVNNKFLRIGDTYADIKSGMFSSKSIEHDSYHKVVHHGSVRYTEDLPSMKAKYTQQLHITPGSVYVPTGESFLPQVPDTNIPKFHESKAFDEFPDSRVFYNSTGGIERFEKASDTGVVSTGSLGDPSQLTRNLHTMQQRHDRYTALEIEVYGLSGLQVGDCINLDTPVLGVNNTKLQDQRWGADYYITKLVHKVILRAGAAMYKQTLVICPKGPARYLPDNGYLTGGDSKTGVIDAFFNKKER